MQRLLALILVLIGLTGLVLGRLGETTWAPETETTATVDLSDAGPAVVIDPGVLYVGGQEGELVIEGASDVSVITAGGGDIDAYLEGVHHTRVTGASDWTTLSTEEMRPDGEDELADPTSSDLWRTVDTAPSPYTLDIHDFWAGENDDPNGEDNEQPYRALLIVTDGTDPGAERISITWPVDAENEWVSLAYACGATIAVIGLVLLVVSLGGRRRDEEATAPVEDAPGTDDDEAAPPVAAGAAADGAAAAAPRTEDAEPSSAAGEDVDVDQLFAAAPQQPREQNVWSLGASPDTDPVSEDPETEGSAAEGSAAEDPAAEDRTEQIDAVDDEDRR